MSEWRPIETAPKDGTWFLGGVRVDGGMLCKTAHFLEVPYFTKEMIFETFCPNRLSLIGPFTHWMPLPEPPELKSKEKL